MTNTPETLNILNPDFRMPEHCGGDRWSILHGDSLQIIRQFVPNSFDAIITDPPYASGGSSQTTKNRSTSEKYSSMSLSLIHISVTSLPPLLLARRVRWMK